MYRGIGRLGTDQGSIKPSRILKTLLSIIPSLIQQQKPKDAFMIFTLHCSLLYPADWWCISALTSAPAYCLFVPSTKYIYLSWNWPCMNAFEKCPLFKVSLSLNRHWIILTGTLSRAADWQNEWLRLHAALPVIDWVGVKIIYNLWRSKGLWTTARKEDICKWFTCTTFINLVQTSQLLPKLLQ